MRNLLVSLAFLVFITIPCYPSNAGGPPSPAEIVGYWRLIEWPNPDSKEINPWPLPYQWFAFYEDGRILSMMSTEDKVYSASELREIFKKLGSNVPRYHWEGEFLVIENPNIPGQYEIWGMNLFARNVGDDVKKGDLIMSLAGEPDGHPVYYGLLRKVR